MNPKGGEIWDNRERDEEAEAKENGDDASYRTFINLCTST
jgi:hypothetical protein